MAILTTVVQLFMSFALGGWLKAGLVAGYAMLAYICYYFDETLGPISLSRLKCGDAFPITRAA